VKKLLWLALILSLALVFMAGCGGGSTVEDPQDDSPVDEPTEEPAVDGEIATLGMGVVTSIGRSLDYDEEGEILAMAQVDNTIAVASFDSEGKIVDVMIDVAQTRVNFDADQQVASDLTAEIKTNKELGPDYNMKVASEIEKEWDEQIAALEEWMVGKTVAEVKALGLTDEGAPDDPDLATSVTITVTAYMAALDKAYNNAVAVEPGAASLGLGHNVSIGRSVGYKMVDDTEILPMAQVDVVIAAAVFSADGQIAGLLIDTAQTRVNFDIDGKVTSDRAGTYLTKRELGDDYGMRVASPIGREWHEQIADLEAWMIGKTVDQVLAMALEDGAPSEPDLVTAVTITVPSYLSALEEAFARAR
jgi:hypothetical protein